MAPWSTRGFLSNDEVTAQQEVPTLFNLIFDLFIKQLIVSGVGDARMDENGNPFGTVNGISPFLPRTSPSGTNTTNITSANTVSGNPTSKVGQRNKNKKKGENVLLSDHLPGFVGHRVS